MTDRRKSKRVDPPSERDESNPSDSFRSEDESDSQYSRDSRDRSRNKDRDASRTNDAKPSKSSKEKNRNNNGNGDEEDPSATVKKQEAAKKETNKVQSKRDYVDEIEEEKRVQVTMQKILVNDQTKLKRLHRQFKKEKDFDGSRG